MGKNNNTKLTPEEEQELAQLEAEFAQTSDLTPEEEQELTQLEAENTLKELEVQGITPSTPPSAGDFGNISNNLEALNKLNTEGPLGSKANTQRLADLIGAKEATGDSIASRIIDDPKRWLGEKLGVDSDLMEKSLAFDPMNTKKTIAQGIDMFMPGNMDIATLGISKLAGLAVKEVNTAEKFVQKFGTKVLKIPEGKLVVAGQRAENVAKKDVVDALKNIWKYKDDFFGPSIKSNTDFSKRVVDLGYKAETVIADAVNKTSFVLDNTRLQENLVSKIPEIANMKDPVKMGNRVIKALKSIMPDQYEMVLDSLVNKTPISGDVLYNALKNTSKARASIPNKISGVDVNIAREVGDLIKGNFSEVLPSFEKFNDLKNISATFQKEKVLEKVINNSPKFKLKGSISEVLKSNVGAIKEFVSPTNISKQAEALTKATTSSPLIPQIQQGAAQIQSVSKGLQGTSAAWERYNATKQK